MPIKSPYAFSVNDIVFIDDRDTSIRGTITRIQNEIVRIKTEDGRKKDRHISKIKPFCEASTNRITIPKFDISEKFQFLGTSVQLVGQRKAVSVLIVGQGGLGKTHTVKATLKDLDIDYKLIKGNATAKGLFDALVEYNGEVIVFDDCDSVLEDRISRNILKGAIDSYDQRVISWFNGEGLQSVNFNGYVIFISNKKIENIDQPLRTRCMVIDVTMSVPEILERMEQLIEDFSPDVALPIKLAALEMIKKYAYNIPNLSLRTLKTVITCAASEADNWERLALYYITN